MYSKRKIGCYLEQRVEYQGWITKGHKETFGVMDMLIILIVVMVFTGVFMCQN